MCGPGDPAETALLRAGQLSKRIVQLRAVLDQVDRRAPEAGEKAALADNFDVLAALHQSRPEVVGDLLAGPQVGAWAASCLRALVGASPSPVPLWVHLAHLGSVALAAALACDQPASVRAVLRDGVLVLPGIGWARTGGAPGWEPAVAGCTDGGLVIDGTSATVHRNRPLGTERLSVPVDELDPYLDELGARSVLDESDAARWQAVFAEAVEVLATRHPTRLNMVRALLRCVVCLPGNGVSATSTDAPGAVALTEPIGGRRLAATLVHELQHVRLGALHDLRALHLPPDGRVHYSPWRADPRPVAGLLHGCHAFLAVAQFWRVEHRAGDRIAGLEYARHVGQLRLGVSELADAGGLTPFGAAVADRLAAAVAELDLDGVHGDLVRVAADLVAEHRASWRLRNVPADPVAAQRLADLVRTAPPLELSQMDGEIPAAGALLPAATEWARTGASADPVLAGDYPAVERDCLVAIAGGAASPAVWARLAVATGHRHRDSVTARRPELVRAALALLAPADTARLAGYVAGTSMSDSIRW